MAKAKAAGSFLGGFSNNLGVVAIALGLGALFIFRDKISNFFQTSLEGLGKIDLPSIPNIDIKFPDIKFPDIKFPDFSFPEINIPNPFLPPNVTPPNPDFPPILPVILPPIHDPNDPFVGFDPNEPKIINPCKCGSVFTGVGLGGSGQFVCLECEKSTLVTGPVVDQGQFQGPSINTETGFTIFDFAEQAGITPAQAFQLEKTSGLSFAELANIPTFGEVLKQFPQLTASQIANLKFEAFGQDNPFDFGTNTGMALEVAQGSFGQTLQDLNLTKAFEEFKASFNPVFGGTSNFANPNFPITAGEAFLGKKGSVVSPSISNLNEEQLQDFLKNFG